MSVVIDEIVNSDFQVVLQLVAHDPEDIVDDVKANIHIEMDSIDNDFTIDEVEELCSWIMKQCESVKKNSIFIE